jgi:hypothetical protein
MLHRYDIINHTIQRYFNEECKYLEIGVADPRTCFDRIIASDKTSVDPDTNYKYDFNMKSDDFFCDLFLGKTRFKPDHKWDVIFIDGLHLAEAVYNDALNALEHISDGGFIFFHDCNPENFMAAHSDYEFFKNNIHEWNGTTWKAFYKLRTELDCKTYCVDTDHGIGVIEVSKPGVPIPHTNEFYEFGELKRSREHYLGLISIFDFLKMHR